MIKTDCCPVCNSQSMSVLKEHIFKFPGEYIENKDYYYKNLWILFEKILKSREDVVFESVLCASCGFIFTNPRFSENEIKIKYTAVSELLPSTTSLNTLNGRAVNTSGKKINDLINRTRNLIRQRFDDHTINARINRTNNLITNFLNYSSQNKPKILDYGGASGYTLVPFVDSFECGVLDYVKLDMSPGVKYLGKDLDDLKDTDKFDVIILLHVLEHVVNPVKLIKDICRYLDEDGMIYVEVPFGCFDEWKYLTTPLIHINFFSEQSLFKCFDLCGLNVIYINTSISLFSGCVSIIGTKHRIEDSKHIKKCLSTQEQMSKIRYLLLFLPRFLLMKLKSITK